MPAFVAKSGARCAMMTRGRVINPPIHSKLWHIYKWGIQVPLVFGYTIDFSNNYAMSVFTGPQLRYAFAGEIVIKDEDLKNDDITYLRAGSPTNRNTLIKLKENTSDNPKKISGEWPSRSLLVK